MWRSHRWLESHRSDGYSFPSTTVSSQTRHPPRWFTNTQPSFSSRIKIHQHENISHQSVWKRIRVGWSSATAFWNSHYSYSFILFLLTITCCIMLFYTALHRDKSKYSSCPLTSINSAGHCSCIGFYSEHHSRQWGFFGDSLQLAVRRIQSDLFGEGVDAASFVRRST